MDYSIVLVKFYNNISWSCGETYESIEWNDTETPKPTKEHLEGFWVEVLKNEMRKKRKDYTALPDFPNRDMYIEYRQQLRDFPAVWTEGMAFPEKPLLRTS